MSAIFQKRTLPVTPLQFSIVSTFVSFRIPYSTNSTSFEYIMSYNLYWPLYLIIIILTTYNKISNKKFQLHSPLECLRRSLQLMNNSLLYWSVDQTKKQKKNNSKAKLRQFYTKHSSVTNTSCSGECARIICRWKLNCVHFIYTLFMVSRSSTSFETEP